MNPINFQFAGHLQRRLVLLSVVALAAMAAGWLLLPVRAHASLFIAVYMVLTIGLGGLVLIALEYVTGAGWSVVFRRIPESLALTLPAAGLAMFVLIAVAANDYAWEPQHGVPAGTFWFKELWLQPEFFVSRAAAYVVLWSLLAWGIVRRSHRQDHAADPRLTSANRRLSALALLLFAPTFSLASMDWFMALEPLWFSTIWGAYHFAGLATSTLATVILLAIHLQRGPLRGLFGDDHLHDLGKLLLGFSCFWMYLWFSQYMLIWYANIPEETAYFVPRVQGAWGPLLVANLALNWFIPFFALLPRTAKRSSMTMSRIAVVVLIGRWLDLYLMVYPSAVGPLPAWGLPEAAAILLSLGLLGLLFFHALSRSSLIPVGDPFLNESLQLGKPPMHSPGVLRSCE